MSHPKPYGDVAYADPDNGKYPIDTEEHIRAAWNYAHKYHESKAVLDRIIAAWKSKIDPAGPPSAAQMGARQETLRVVKDNSPRGGLVEMPVAHFAKIDLAKTAGKGKGEFELDRQTFEDVLANFEKKPGPVPVYFGHGNRSADTPAIGFVRKIWINGDTLWNQIDLTPRGWDLIVTQRGFAAASVEMSRDQETALGDLKGWAQTGLAITNTPALDVQYLAAEANGGSRDVISTPGLAFQQTESTMEVTLEGLQADKLRLEAEIKSKDGRIAELEQAIEDKDKAHGATATAYSKLQLEAAQSNATLTEKTGTIRALEHKVEALTADLSSATAKAARLEKSGEDDAVRRIMKVAMAAGVDAKYFDGAEQDPSGWLKKNFVGLEALQKFVEVLPRRKGAILSQRPNADGEDEVAVSAEVAAELRRRGLDPKYAALESSEELAQMKASSK